MKQVFLTNLINLNTYSASVGYTTDSFNMPYGWDSAKYTIKK